MQLVFSIGHLFVFLNSSQSFHDAQKKVKEKDRSKLIYKNNIK